MKTYSKEDVLGCHVEVVVARRRKQKRRQKRKSSSFGSAITFLHFLHSVISSGSYIGIKTLTLFGTKRKKEGFGFLVQV